MPAAPDRSHVALARLQRADGSWHLDDELCLLLGVDRDQLRQFASRLLGSGEESELIVATMAALTFLETRAADARDEWRLLAGKAEGWLANALASRPSVVREDVEMALASLP